MSTDNETAVAALIYFREGVTKGQVRSVLEQFATLLEQRKDDVQIDREMTVDRTGMTVNNYDPRYGGPVWYIP